MGKIYHNIRFLFNFICFRTLNDGAVIPHTDITENLVPIPRAPHSLSSVDLCLHEIEDSDKARGVDRPLKRHSSFQFHDKSWDSVIGLNFEGLDPRCNVITSLSSRSSGSRSSSSISSSSSDCCSSGRMSRSRGRSSGVSHIVKGEAVDTAQHTMTLEDVSREKDQVEMGGCSRINTRSRSRLNESIISNDPGSPLPFRDDNAEPSVKKQRRKRSLSTNGLKVEAASRAVKPASSRIRNKSTSAAPGPDPMMISDTDLIA